MKSKLATALLLLGAASAIGCGDSTRPKDRPPMRLVAGADISDTVLSILTQALVVEVNVEGRPVPGTVVRFQSLPADTNATWKGMGAYTSPPDRNQFGAFLADTTDQNGHASAMVQLGKAAGTAAIVVTAPDIGAEDTAHFTVRAGKPASVTITPHDTALYIGASFTPSGSAVDAYQNPTEADISFRAVGSSIGYKDGLVEALQLGVGQVIVTFGSKSDTSQVDVVPQMTFGAIQNSAVVMSNADGSGYKMLVPATSARRPFTTDWDPTGTLLAYDEREGTETINTVDVQGSVKKIGAEHAFGLYPEFSPDGNWVYYARESSGFTTYRAHTDGSGEEAVTITPQPNTVSPSLSPDGGRLAFSTGDRGQVAIVDLATGDWSYVDGAMGTSPAWSPDGTHIAYVATGNDGARLHTVALDGSDNHRVGDPNNSYDVGIDWSPDGAWIIARNSSRNYLELIDVVSNVTYPLHYTTGYRGPSWKP